MDSSAVRNDFPSIRKGHGIYLDSACQTLRPDSVIAAMDEYYSEYPACGGRSVHSMASKVSVGIDEVREKLAGFFGTDDPECYAFTQNCTQGLNTAAYGLGLRKGDVVVTTDSEHNSNHVPWLRLQETVGIERRMSRSGKEGVFDIDSFIDCMKGPVKVVAVQHASNVTGCTVPVKAVTDIAHDKGAIVVIDGAQAAPHRKVDLKRIDADIYCLSIHKMLGPSGMGVMYGKREILEKLRPLSVGGGTVGLSTYDSSNQAPIPDRFEAGLQNYSGILGTGAALDYLSRVGMDEIERWDNILIKRAMDGLEDLKNLSIVGPTDPEKRGGILSFNIDGLNAHDIAMMADSMAGIMIRSGMHCAHPFYVSRSIDGSARASTYLYNTPEEMDAFVSTVRHIAEVFGNRYLRIPIQREAPAERCVRFRCTARRLQPHQVPPDLQPVVGCREDVRPAKHHGFRTIFLEGIQHGGYPISRIAVHRSLAGILHGTRDNERGRHQDRTAHAQGHPGEGELHHDLVTSTQSRPSLITARNSRVQYPDRMVSSDIILNTGASSIILPTTSPSTIALTEYASADSPPIPTALPGDMSRTADMLLPGPAT